MKKLTLCLLAFMVLINVNGQETIKSRASSSKMSILGTSTLHDWESVVESFEVTAKFSPSALQDVRFEAEVESIKSGKGGMDKNTYKAMNSSKHPKITFVANSLTISGNNITGSGRLTIAGTTKTINMKMAYESWSAGEYLVRGEVKFKMSEYGVDPPVAMLGAVKTGDEVTIKFEVLMTK